jgi:hypothetical protein
MVSPIFETESSSLELEVVNMTRSLIIKLFWGSIIGLIAGLVLMGVTVARVTRSLVRAL